MRTVRLFVSSPGDVEHERRRVERVAERLNGEFAGVARLETIRWETSFYSAHTGFQAQIPEAADCDLVVAIFWARLGSELPPDFRPMPNGEPYPSGSAYEVLSAIQARETRDNPDIFVFRKTERPQFAIDDAGELERVRGQWDRLKSFFERWFLTPQGHFRAAFQSFQTTDEFEATIEALLRVWLEEHVLHGRSLTWPIATKGSPFRGLAPFEARHSPVFFGRARDIARAIDRLKSAADRQSRFLLIVGASGAGKSSLVRAGLIPRLTTPGVVAGIDMWRVAVMRPGTRPVAALAEALFASGEGGGADGGMRALPELAEGDSKTPAELAALLRNADATAERPLLRALERIEADEQKRGGFARPVRADLMLVVDQLDDLFAADVSAEDRTTFAKLLRLLVASGRVWVVTTLRATLYEPFLAEPEFKALKDAGADYDLAPPGPAELAEIVRKPAEAAGLIYERNADGVSLDERLLQDAGDAAALPLLQFTLNELYEQRQVIDGETRLTFAAYAGLAAQDAIGGLDGAISRVAERALAGLGEAEVAALPRLLRQLVVPVHDAAGRGAFTIRVAPLAEAAPDATTAKLAEGLIQARILLVSGDEGVPIVSLAHQRVLESWKRARDIVASNADFFRIRDDVEDQLRRWEASGGKAELLLARGVPLAEAEKIVANFGTELGSEIRNFVATSGRRARFRQRLTAAAAVVFAVVAVGASILGFFAYRLEQRARAERARAEASYAAASQAVDRLIFDVVQGLGNVEGMRVESIARILETVDNAVKRLAETNTGDLKLQRSRAVMLNNFANAYATKGDLARARAAAEESLAITRKLVAIEPKNTLWEGDAVWSLISLANALDGLGDRAGALAAYEESLALARKLAKALPAQIVWQINIAVTLLRSGKVHAILGQRSAALAAYEECVVVARKIVSIEPKNPYGRGNLAWALLFIGDLVLPAGDNSRALASFEEALSIRRELLAADPGNTQLQRDVSASLQRIGDVRTAMGDSKGALAAHMESLELVRKLIALDPNNTGWQRDVSVGLLRIGDIHRSLGDNKRALVAFQEGLDISRKLSASDPANTEWQNDVGIRLERIGDIKWEFGDRDAALALYEEILAVDRKLVAADPNVMWRSNLAIILGRVGGARRARGEYEAALKHYEESLDIRRKLAEADPGDLSALRSVGFSLTAIGDIRLEIGDHAKALTAYEEGLAIDRKLVSADPKNARWQNDASVSLRKIGDVHAKQGDDKRALVAYEECLAIRRKLLAADPENGRWQRNVDAILVSIAELHASNGANEKALAAYEEKSRTPPQDFRGPSGRSRQVA